MSMYRQLLRSGVVEVTYREQALFFDEIKVLEGKAVHDPDSKPQLWRKMINLELADLGITLKGFAAIREMGKASGSVLRFSDEVELFKGFKRHLGSPMRYSEVGTRTKVSDCSVNSKLRASMLPLVRMHLFGRTGRNRCPEAQKKNSMPILCLY